MNSSEAERQREEFHKIIKDIGLTADNRFAGGLLEGLGLGVFLDRIIVTGQLELFPTVIAGVLGIAGCLVSSDSRDRMATAVDEAIGIAYTTIHRLDQTIRKN